ncbi:MAG: SurA N-terminal domain-containing protein [Spirochaetia bacterium]|nr:SurA N-terminal domain-containing protein [Spirochaetia bacterium]
MKFSEKLIKIVSYTFISLLVLIIIIAFGMPDFIGQAGLSSQFLVAKVDDDIITRKDLTSYIDREYKGRLQGQNIPPEFEEQLKRSALERLINQKLLEKLYKQSGFFPLGTYQNRIIADYLKSEFSSYNTIDGFDFNKFEEEWIKSGRISFTDIKSWALRSFAFEVGQNMLSDMISVNYLESIEKERLNKIKLSYQIVAIDKQKQDEIIKAKIPISEVDIENKFKTDYLSKDPKAEMTKVKREAIVNALVNERKTDIEKEWKDSLSKYSSDDSLNKIATQNMTKVFSIDNVSPIQNINSVKPQESPNLLPLFESDEFTSVIFSESIGKRIGPIENSGVFYFITITKREIPDVIDAEKIMTEKKEIKEYFPNDYTEIETFANNIKTEHENSMLSALINLTKQNSNIIYYTNLEPAKETNP